MSLNGGSYTVFTSKPGFSFNPPRESFSNFNFDVFANFVGTAAPTPTPTPTPTATPTPASTPASFLFSAASFSVGEGAGSAQHRHPNRRHLFGGERISVIYDRFKDETWVTAGPLKLVPTSLS